MARGRRAEGLWINLFSVQMERTQTLEAWTPHTFSASRKFRMAATQRQLHRVLSKSFNPANCSSQTSSSNKAISSHKHSGPHHTDKLDFTQPVSRAISRLGASRKAEGVRLEHSSGTWGWQSWKQARHKTHTQAAWREKHCCNELLRRWPKNKRPSLASKCRKNMRQRRSGVSNMRPAGQIRPANGFDPAREMIM